MADIEIPVKQTVTYKGKTLRSSPLGLAQLLELASHIRDTKMETCKRQIAGLPLELAKHAWSESKSESEKVQIGTVEMTRESQKYDAQIYALWMSVNVNHSDFSLDDAGELFGSSVRKFSLLVGKSAGYEAPDPTKPVQPAN